MTKHFLVSILLLFIFQIAQSQNFTITPGKKDFDNASVFLINGETLIGEVQDFNSPNFIEFEGNPFSFTLSGTTMVENELNIDRKKIKFRKNENEKFRKIPADSIDIIRFYDDEFDKTREYRRMRIAKSINGNVKITKRTLFLPMFRKGAINLYGYHFIMGGGYATTIFYLNNPNNNVAIAPYDVKLSDLFAARKKLYQRIISSYKYTSGDCTSFHKWLDDNLISGLESITKDDYKKLRKEIKQGKKALKTKDQKREYEAEKWTAYYMRGLLPPIEKYEELCE